MRILTPQRKRYMPVSNTGVCSLLAFAPEANTRPEPIKLIKHMAKLEVRRQAEQTGSAEATNTTSK